MLASQIGAYQAASYASTARDNSGFELARVAALQAKPEFPKSANGVETRGAVVPANEANGAKNKPSGQATGRGRFLDVLA